MVAAASVELSQAGVSSILDGTAADLRLSQTFANAIVNFPSEEIQSGQVFVSLIADEDTRPVEISQAHINVVCRGRIDDPTVRAWTYTLDGHDYYVLRLGDDETLVYDTYSQQWMDWRNFGRPNWRASYGVNWIGGEALAQAFGSNVVCGDDSFGLLWFLDPEQPYDQSPRTEIEIQEIYFERIVMGQVPMKGREVMPCNAVWLTSDMGSPAYAGAGVQLLVSDDAGRTFADRGTITVTVGKFSPEITWRSLGQIQAPGRLFRIVDDGAITRIDGLEMNDPNNAG
jgi:hypothetical protein